MFKLYFNDKYDSVVLREVKLLLRLLGYLVLILYFYSSSVYSKVHVYSSDSDYKADLLSNSFSSDSYQSLLRSISDTYDLEILPFARAMKYIKTRKEASCLLFARKNNERVDEYFFSLPVAILPSVSLYQKRSDKILDKSVLNESGKIPSLEKLMASDEKSSLLLASGISYGDFLDEEIKKVEKNQIYRVSLGGADNPVFDILSHRKVDYALMFSSALRNENISKLRAYEIEGNEGYTSSHILCNRTKESREWLAKVNNKLIDLYHTPNFIEEVLVDAPTHLRREIKSQLLSLSNPLEP